MILFHQNEHRGISHFSIGCNLERWLIGFIIGSVSCYEFGKLWNLQVLVLCFKVEISWIVGEASGIEEDEA